MGRPSNPTALQKRRKAPECETCFKRRIKCDGQRPECRKCVARGLQCPGILAEFDLKFRDQSQAVKKKVQKHVSATADSPTVSPAQKRNFKPQPASPAILPGAATAAGWQNVTRNTSPDHPNAGRQLVPFRMPKIKQSVHLSPGTFTVGLFFDGHENMLGASGAADPWIAYMKPAVARAEHMTPLRLAAEALSLAVFGNRSQQRGVTLMAMERYASCMSVLRNVISDPIEAAADSTLMAVLLLTIYEYVTSNDQGGKERFCRHADGVVALAVYRRRTGSVFHQQLQMFWVVITSMVMRYSFISKTRTTPKKSIPVPVAMPAGDVANPEQVNVRNWITGLTAASPDPAGQLFELMLASIVLRSRSHDLHLLPTASDSTMAEEVKGILANAVGMHKRLDEWDQKLPRESRPQAHRIHHSPSDEVVESLEIWSGRLLTFDNLDVACTYNQWRTLQIVVLGVTIRNLHWLRLHVARADRDVQFDSLCATLYDHVDGICASVPYFLGLKQSQSAKADATAAQYPSLDGRGALSIAVLLQFCLLVEGVPSNQRRWMQGRLRYIAEHVGVRYAIVGARAESPCLIFEGDPLMLATFGGRQGHALSTASLSVRPASASPKPVHEIYQTPLSTG